MSVQVNFKVRENWIWGTSGKRTAPVRSAECGVKDFQIQIQESKIVPFWGSSCDWGFWVERRQDLEFEIRNLAWVYQRL